MLFACKLDYNIDDALGKLTEEQYASLRKSSKSFDWPETREEAIKQKYSFMGAERIIDAQEIEVITSLGLHLTVHRAKGMIHHNNGGEIVSHVNLVKDLADIISCFHQSNVGLFDVTHVTYAEDCCTNKLQDWLSEGWKIIAVCPPNDSRRPTYILGWVGKDPRRPDGREFLPGESV